VSLFFAESIGWRQTAKQRLRRAIYFIYLRTARELYLTDVEVNTAAIKSAARIAPDSDPTKQALHLLPTMDPLVIVPELFCISDCF